MKCNLGFLRRPQKFEEISPLFLTLFSIVKTKRNISLDFVAVTEHMNYFNIKKANSSTKLARQKIEPT